MSGSGLSADELTLPIKRVEGDTLEERLTGNAYDNILPARYLRKDANGDLIEEQEDLFERVAKNIALAEAVFEAEKQDEEITVTPDQLKPDHPRRDELAAEVFGKGTTADDDVETTLSVYNVNKFAYETLVPDLPDGVREHVEDTAAEFQELMERLSFMPNSPTLMNAGDELQQLSACFVDSPEDDIDDIHETAKEAAQVFQSGGGMGYAFWRLRPYGDAVGSTGGIASGPITFMRTYDQMCFPPGTRVLTPDGQRPIEDIDEGDLVIDENGDRQPVVETMERHVDEDIVEITPKRLNRPVRATGEHPFKVARDDGFEWVDAEDLRPGDRLVLGHAAGENDLSIDDTLDLTTIASGPLVFADGGVTVNREYYDATKGTSPRSFASEVPVGAFATMAGWYLAEGCVVYRRGMPAEVTFTLHSDEHDAAADIQQALEAFDVPSRIERVDDRNTLHVHAEHTSFAQFVEELFGTGASRKRVPDVLWNAAPSVQARVLEALFEGDGRLEKRGESQRVKLKLTCEDVIDFAFQAGLRCGVQFSRHDREPDDRRPTYEVSASVSTALGTPLERLFDDVDDDFAARDRTKQAHGREVVEIDSVTRTEYDGPVHNAEVADTHTYVAEDLVVHNCETIAQGGARRGAQMGVMRVSHPDVIQFIHAKNKDVSLAETLRLNDPDDFTHNSFADALEEARELIDDDGKVPKHLRNAVEGHLSNFNISVGITDRFMEAAKNGEDYTFTNPRTGEPHVATAETKELYDMFDLGEHVEVGEVLSVPAEKLWEHIVEGAHENGEPGVIYLERVNKEHSFDVEEHPDHRILATNPCVTGDTLISTENGLVTAEELYEQGVARDVVVDGRLSEDRVKEASSVYKTGEKDVYELETEEGYELRLTGDHRVMTDDGWVETQNLEPGQTVHIQNRKGAFGQHGSAEEGRVLGWLAGDGHLKHGEERAVLNFYDQDTEVSEQFAADVNEIAREPTGNADYEIGVNEITRSDDYRGAQALEQRIRSTRLYEYAEEAGLAEEKLQVPDAVMRGSEEMARGFLQALFSADGSVQGSAEKGISVRLASADADFLKEVQQLLVNFGIGSQIYEDRKEPGVTELPDGDGGVKEYETKGFHELVVSSAHTVTFEEEIGFLLDYKNEALAERLEEYSRGPYSPKFEATVESVEPDGHEAVYDLTEPDTNSFVADGLVVHNCGEQPLEEYEACNLGHINLSTIADFDAPDWRVWYDEHGDEYADIEAAVDAFLEDAVDFEEFDYRIEMGTRFLENVVTMSDFPVPEIEQKVREMRKIGLGVMGLAQLYIQLGIEYGSDAGNEVARQLMRHINHGSKWASHELAEDRGAFDEWGNSKYANPTEYREWFEKQTGLDADEWAEGFPIRNHNTTTIAPTGTTSMVGNTTGGCEPIYNVAYYKNVSDDVQGDEMLVEFDDYFLRTLEDNDIDVEAVKQEATQQMGNNEFDGLEGLETVPDPIGELFVTTGSLSAKQHAGVQVACQEGVDSAISKTVNAPNDSTVEDAKEVFEYIYEHGGKGVTYYRDGTRSKQVLTTRAKNTEFAEMDEDEAVDVLTEQIEDIFGSVDAFLDREEVRASLAADPIDIFDIDIDADMYADKRARPDALRGVSQRIDTGYGKIYVTINEDPETKEPFELFANIGHSGGFTNSFTEALAKVISTALRSGVDPMEIVDELQGTRSPKVAWDKGEQIQSIPDAIGTAMRRYLEDEVDKPYPKQKTLEETVDETTDETPVEGAETASDPNAEIATDTGSGAPEPDGGPESLADSGAHQSPPGSGDGATAAAKSGEDATQDLISAGESPECPECGAMTLYYSEGCKTCESCGWSEC
jgi:ribonucleoside-diphosphate reductase alpha chain